MTAHPVWLPARLSLEGTFKQIIGLLYDIFVKDFKKTSLWFRERRVTIHPEKWDKHYEMAFWHIISKQLTRDSEERVIDSERASRLPWCRPVIANSEDSRILVWDYREGRGQVRAYIWLREFDYVVILEKKKIKPTAQLVTAFHIEGDAWRRTLARKYDKREKEKQPSLQNNEGRSPSTHGR